MESRPHADVCSHDLSAAVGTVGIPRERPRVLEVRTVEHLEHHDRALLELKPDAHGAETTFLTREPRMAHPVLPERIAHHPNVSRTLQFVQRECWVARMDTRTHGEVIHSRRHKIVSLCFLLIEDPTTPRHRAVTSEMNNEKKGPEAFGPRARNMFAMIPLRPPT